MNHEHATSKERLYELTSHVMVDFVQMKSFTEAPLIMVEGDGVYSPTSRAGATSTVSRAFAVSLGTATRSSTRRGAVADARVLVADHDHERPGARAAAELLDLTGGRCASSRSFAAARRRPGRAQARTAIPSPDGPGRALQAVFLSPYHGGRWALGATGWPNCATLYGATRPAPSTFATRPTLSRVPGWPCSLDCFELLKDGVELEGPRTVAALILEPVMLTAGVAAAGSISLVRELCDRPACCFAFDEIVTGFGGWGICCRRAARVWPDALLRQGPGGYVPLSGVLLTPRVAGRSGVNRRDLQFQSGHTFAGVLSRPPAASP
jgi:adenosylmethionine-8-amino-7-oxononanoate aminotransferase